MEELMDSKNAMMEDLVIACLTVQEVFQIIFALEEMQLPLVTALCYQLSSLTISQLNNIFKLLKP